MLFGCPREGSINIFVEVDDSAQRGGEWNLRGEEGGYVKGRKGWAGRGVRKGKCVKGRRGE